MFASRRFSVALSFAGEFRKDVAPIADALAQIFSPEKILYDKFHDAELARADLNVYLPTLYRTQADLVVVFLCPEYARKLWCKLEWRHIGQLIATLDAHRIMFVSFGDVGDLSSIGILSGDGYIDIRQLPPSEVAAKISLRLRRNREDECSKEKIGNADAEDEAEYINFCSERVLPSSDPLVRLAYREAIRKGDQQINMAVTMLEAMAAANNVDVGNLLKRAAKAHGAHSGIVAGTASAESNVLIALYLANEYSRLGLRKCPPPGKLNSLWPHQINAFIKEIVSASEPNHRLLGKTDISEDALVTFCSFVLKETDDKSLISLRAHCCYLLGRVCTEQCKTRANELLKKELIRLRKQLPDRYNGVAGRSMRHLRRTTLISLAVLDDYPAAREYLSALLASPDDDDLNRGFHLEYYGDQKFNARKSMSSHDPRLSCARTFDRLEARVLTAIAAARKGGVIGPLVEIELHTIASLAQVRVDTPYEIDQTRVCDVLSAAIANLPLLDGDLVEYVKLSIQKCSQGYTSVLSSALEFWGTKHTPRTGWCRRQIVYPETTGAHTFGAMILCRLLLPSSTRYDKQRIMDMLLVHDIAEGITGDIPSDDKTPAFQSTEKLIMSRVALIGSFLCPPSDVGKINTSDIFVLYQEFEKGESDDAKIAKDFDRADLILQAAWTLNSGASCTRMLVEEMIEKARNQLKTPEVKAIVERCLKAALFTAQPFQQVKNERVAKYYCSAGQMRRND